MRIRTKVGEVYTEIEFTQKDVRDLDVLKTPFGDGVFTHILSEVIRVEWSKRGKLNSKDKIDAK